MTNFNFYSKFFSSKHSILQWQSPWNIGGSVHFFSYKTFYCVFSTSVLNNKCCCLLEFAFEKLPQVLLKINRQLLSTDIQNVSQNCRIYLALPALKNYKNVAQQGYKIFFLLKYNEGKKQLIQNKVDKIIHTLVSKQETTIVWNKKEIEIIFKNLAFL